MTANTIIVPLDGSHFAERALPVACTLARRVGSRLLVMTTTWNGRADTPAEYLDLTATRCAAGVEVERVVVDETSAARAIAQCEDAADDGIVCMTSHGRTGVRWAVLGSVAEQVIRAGHRPVVLVGRHCDPEWRPDEPIVLAITCSSADASILPAAAEWSKALGLGVHVVNVMHPLDIDGATNPNPAVGAIAEQLEGDGVDAIPVFLRGWYVGGALADYARDLPASMLVLGTHARTGPSRLTLGNVAMATVGLAPCPVLIAPPPDE